MKPKAKIHDDVIEWEHFLRNWPFVRRIHLLPVDSPHKGQWRRALMFSLTCAWTNSWANNRDAGDLRRHRPHCVVTVMRSYFTVQWLDFMHWRRVMHIWVGKLTSIGSDNGLSPGWHQAIIWTNAGILLIRTLGTIFSEILSEVHAFQFKKMHFKLSFAKLRQFCLYHVKGVTPWWFYQ